MSANINVLRHSDIAACPITSLLPSHYELVAGQVICLCRRVSADDVLAKVKQVPGFCGIGHCTGAEVWFPLTPPLEDGRMTTALVVQCCIFCVEDVANVMPGAEVRV